MCSLSDLFGARPPRPAQTLGSLVLGVSEVGSTPRAGREPMDKRWRGVGRRPWQPRAGWACVPRAANQLPCVLPG